MKLNCSWEDLAFVTGGAQHALNRDRVVRCLELATSKEEAVIRNSGLRWDGAAELAWEGALWLVNVELDWLDAAGECHRIPFAPDALLRRFDFDDPVAVVEGVMA